ncbi:toxin-antitoxin system HicB family antitoxin [Limnohabitans sp. Rim8]|uniref:toxin-antitoxin system HicB family antitoxin n=1 Tax=Limnohabitans sp. Rim8 TaxID=1100718 RepID=UPI0025F25255|nr:toxin-antitoxin system HicB family antitoxin [Limnohabitans sp. Rim8]
MPQLIWSPQALLDVQRLSRFLAPKNQHAAKRAVTAIRQSVKVLSLQPGQDYLADCKEQGVQPEKPASGKLLLRVPPEIHDRAIVAAQAAGKCLNRWATEVLQHAVQPG